MMYLHEPSLKKFKDEPMYVPRNKVFAPTPIPVPKPKEKEKQKEEAPVIEEFKAILKEKTKDVTKPKSELGMFRKDRTKK